MRYPTLGVALFLAVLLFPTIGGAYEAIEVRDGGVLTGTVRFTGTVPSYEPIGVKKNRDVCGESKPVESLIVGPARELKNAVVYIEKIGRGKKFEAKAPVLDNEKCLFVPHVLAMSTKQKLVVRNSDPILHNTHTYLRRLTVFNLALPIQDQVIKKRVRKPGAIKVLCDAHTHMYAWVVALDHPYFAVTDDEGSFRIDNVPPGTYKLVAWHEGWEVKGRDRDGRLVFEAPRRLTQAVTVRPNVRTPVAFEFK